MQTDQTPLASHEVATLLPPMEEADYRELARDIRAHGLIEPIWLYEGQIVDGRHRYRACLDAGVQPRFREWGGTGSLVDFVLSPNLHRRHLGASQKATVAVSMVPLLAEEARRRQKDLAGTRPHVHPGADLRQSFDEGLTGRAAEVAGSMVGVNRQYVYDAMRIKRDAPETFEAMHAGTVTMSQAKQLERLPEAQRHEVLARARAESANSFPAAYRGVTQRARAADVTREVVPLTALGKFPILYVDPPWRYDEGSTTPNREIGNHYPTLSLEELCSLPVAAVSQDNALLFLWATSPKLMEAGQVMAAWGFEYRTCCVWVKDRVGMGAWVRQRHELLLIGRRGTWPTPVDAARPDSVVEAPRGEHSAKPALVYTLIETMYPQVPRLELFARGVPRPGWHVWGNQLQPHNGEQNAAGEDGE